MADSTPDVLPQSLPQALLQHAQTHGAQVALRYKRLGIWQVRTWGQLAQDVRRLAGALHTRGFGVDDDLVIISDGRVEALALTLAAQWLGGRVTLLDPARDNRSLLAGLAPQYAVAQGADAVDQMQDASPRVLIYFDKRGLSDTRVAHLTAYTALLEALPVEPPGVVAKGAGIAFVFHSPDGQTTKHSSHAELLIDAQQLVRSQALSVQDQALAARVFAASGQARYLLAPWLIAGFCLNFPESLATRDNDRRELGPTLVLGTRESYARLALAARERLPRPGTFSHSVYRWAMRPSSNALRRTLGFWLVRRPLLDVLGMSRLDKPLLVGDALDAQSAEFFAALGIRPRPLTASIAPSARPERIVEPPLPATTQLA